MSTTRWLNESEMQLWRAVVEVVGRLPQNLDAQLRERSDIGFDDYEVLVHLSESPDRRLRMSDLSDRLVHSQSRLSQRVDRLVDRGWVCREKCEEDRRGTFAVLTDEGFAAIDEAAAGHVADVRERLLDALEPAEIAALGNLLERVAAANR